MNEARHSRPGNNARLVAGRRRARRAAVQALYQWQLTQQPIGAIEEQFRQEQGGSKADMDYFRELLFGVAKGLDELDPALQDCLSRPLAEVDPVERAVLRLAAYELFQRPDIPFRVVINEALDLSKRFGAVESHRFVNGVLDKLAQQARPLEVKARQRDA